MNLSKIIDKLSRVPRAQRMVLYSGLYIILAVAFWALLYIPKGAELEALQATQQELLTQKRQVEARVKNKAQFEADLAKLMGDLKQALKELPNDREIPGLLKGISTLGKKVGLEVRRFTPLPEATRQYVADVPVELEVQGSYHEVAMFFDRLSKMNRIVYVQNISMTEPKERGGKIYLTVTGKAVTFRFLTQDEVEKNSDTGKSKGKKRRRKK